MQLLNNLNDEQLSVLSDIVDKHADNKKSKDGSNNAKVVSKKHVSKMPFIEPDKLQHPNSLMKRAK
jgi:hypothetical protein